MTDMRTARTTPVPPTHMPRDLSAAPVQRGFASRPGPMIQETDHVGQILMHTRALTYRQMKAHTSDICKHLPSDLPEEQRKLIQVALQDALDEYAHAEVTLAPAQDPEEEPPADAGDLENMLADAIRRNGGSPQSPVPEVVRDMASRLPIRPQFDR